MRLPYAKVYRACPELDPFTDAECQRYVATARSRHQPTEILAGLSAVVATIGVIVVLAPTLRGLVEWFIAVLSLRLSVDGRNDLALGLGGGLGVLGGVLAGFMIRDTWLRWAVLKCLRIAKCPCGYSLLGLRVHDGAVTCPECGHALVLASVGLTEADILARSGSDQPTSANPSDSP